MKIKRKLISGGILLICSVFAVMTGAHISQKVSDNTIPVSVGQSEETPVIILDAGTAAQLKLVFYRALIILSALYLCPAPYTERI